MNWYTQYKKAQSREYMIEGGILYDENGDDVFSFKELIKFNVPVFKTPDQANDFLEALESQTGQSYGRVPVQNLLKDLRYKDTRKERQKALEEYIDERNNNLKKGVF